MSMASAYATVRCGANRLLHVASPAVSDRELGARFTVRCVRGRRSHAHDRSSHPTRLRPSPVRHA
jgi:hypothetical protein